LSDAREVFDYWAATFGHPKAKWSPDRKTKIEARLREGYTVAQLRHVCDGVKGSPHHMGKNDSGKVYDSIGLLFRNADNVEKYLGFVVRAEPPKRAERTAGPGWDVQGFYREWFEGTPGDRGFILDNLTQIAKVEKWAAPLLAELEDTQANVGDAGGRDDDDWAK